MSNQEYQRAVERLGAVPHTYHADVSKALRTILSGVALLLASTRLALHVVAPVTRDEHEHEQDAERPRGERHNPSDEEQEREHAETAETAETSGLSAGQWSHLVMTAEPPRTVLGWLPSPAIHVGVIPA